MNYDATDFHEWLPLDARTYEPEALVEMKGRWETRDGDRDEPVVPPRDPSVRDVLAQLDRIETKLDKLLAPKRRVASDGSWVETK